MSEKVKELCNYIDKLPPSTVCLVAKNDMCRILNLEMLNRIDSEIIELSAKDEFCCRNLKLREQLRKSLNDDDNENVSRTAGLARLIKIKIGAKVMIR